MGIVTALVFREQKIFGENYTLYAHLTFKDVGGAFRTGRATNSINWRLAKWSKFILALRKSPNHWTAKIHVLINDDNNCSHKIYIFYHKAIAVYAHISVWVTVISNKSRRSLISIFVNNVGKKKKIKVSIFVIFGFFVFFTKFFCAAPQLREHFTGTVLHSV